MKTSTKLKLAGRGVGGIAGASYGAGKMVGDARARRRSMGTPLLVGAIAGAIGGAWLAYLADPVSGRARRVAAREKLAALVAARADQTVAARTAGNGQPTYTGPSVRL